MPAVRALLSALRAASNRELGKNLDAILRMAAGEKEEFRRKDWLRALLRYYLALEKPPEGLKAVAGTLSGILERKEAEDMTASLAEELILQGRVESEEISSNGPLLRKETGKLPRLSAIRAPTRYCTSGCTAAVQ